MMIDLMRANAETPCLVVYILEDKVNVKFQIIISFIYRFYIFNDYLAIIQIKFDMKLFYKILCIHIQKSWVVCSFAYPRWRFLQARNFYKDFLKKYFVGGCGHFSEVKYLTLHWQKQAQQILAKCINYSRFPHYFKNKAYFCEF